MSDRTRRWLFLTLLPLLIGSGGDTRRPGPGCGPPSRSPYWRECVQLPMDPFEVPGNVGWIKFTILVDDPSTVYFQDEHHYRFHYDFAVAELPQFAGMTTSEFDALTLHAEGQQAILGALLLPPSVPPFEYGIQFIRNDPFPAGELTELFRLVQSHVSFMSEHWAMEAFYFPTYEQQAASEAQRELLEAEGIRIGSPLRWEAGSRCYSPGWAVGTLKRVQPGSIAEAFTAGELLPGDVLLTEAVPAEVPPVAGLISLSPTTPNSHVALLSQAFGLPFIYLADGAEAERAQDLLGHRIVLRADDDGYGACRIRLIDLEAGVDESTIEAIHALRAPLAIELQPTESRGAYSAPAEELEISDLRYFGGKAAHYGLLRRVIPDHAPVAAAFSFDLWNAFEEQELVTGRTLGEEIRVRLAGQTYPPDMPDLHAILDSIRDLIRDPDRTSFGPVLEAAVFGTISDPRYGFDPLQNLRFRSSSNVEDTDQLSSAGLFESFSGCLADDQDGDGLGPSRCDATEDGERGVFRAIRKVFASFYNDNAYLERLRHGIEEDDVGMALLVHHSFPDQIELANGVALLAREANGTIQIHLVTQAGAVSVANPETGALPEEVRVDVHPSNPSNPSLYLARASSLVQLGATIMDFPEDYRDLVLLLVPVAAAYRAAAATDVFTLDFEYKKVAPGTLVVKQVRPVPRADTTPSVTPLLLGGPTEYCVNPGPETDAFAAHRLKSRLTLEVRTMWLSADNLSEGLYTDASLHYVEGCSHFEQRGPLSSWPGASHSFSPVNPFPWISGAVSTQRWEFGHLQNPRRYTLTTRSIPTLLPRTRCPVLVPDDFGSLRLTVEYARPVRAFAPDSPVGERMTEQVSMLPCGPEPSGTPASKTYSGAGGMTVTTSFFPGPSMGACVGPIIAGCTGTFDRFVETVIEGLTSQPIVLKSEYSQTQQTTHHNFGDFFIFEPGLEPGLPRRQLYELGVAGVRVIYIDRFGDSEARLYDAGVWGEECQPSVRRLGRGLSANRLRPARPVRAGR